MVSAGLFSSSFGFLSPDQSSLATHDVGLFVELHFRVVVPPGLTLAGDAEMVTTGLFVPLVPPLPAAVPPPGNDSALAVPPVLASVAVFPVPIPLDF